MKVKNTKKLHPGFAYSNLSETTATLDLSTVHGARNEKKYNDWANSKTLAMIINDKMREEIIKKNKTVKWQ